VTAMYNNREISLPVGYELVLKTDFVHDPKTMAPQRATYTMKRQSPISKNEHARALVAQAVKNQIPFKYGP